MRTSAEWLSYFRENAHREPPGPHADAAAIEPRLRGALIHSLGRFYLGEAGEGRVAGEAARSSDPALDGAMRECIALYVREEGRHARALAGVIAALGGRLPKRHYSEVLFRRGRRFLGLRTKMLTIAAAEAVGRAYYCLLADHVPALAPVMRAIANDEREHLAFQADYFARVLAKSGGPPALRRLALAASYATLLSCAVTTVIIDHAPLLDALGVTRAELSSRCLGEAWEGARASALALPPIHAHRSLWSS